MPQGGAIFVLGTRSKFEFFRKFEEHSLCARLRPLKRRTEKTFHNSRLVGYGDYGCARI